MKNYCSHYWGKEYETVNGKKICYFTLDGAKEAYEVSFVAVPAQPRAGTTKNYGGKELTVQKEENTDEGVPPVGFESLKQSHRRLRAAVVAGARGLRWSPAAIHDEVGRKEGT